VGEGVGLYTVVTGEALFWGAGQPAPWGAIDQEKARAEALRLRKGKRCRARKGEKEDEFFKKNATQGAT